MLNAILEILAIMGWLGAILGILTLVNICTNTICNIWSSKELFSWKKFVKGIGKAIVFYLSAVAISVAFTMLPYVNGMIVKNFEVALISNETLEVLSSVGVLGVVITTIISEAKKAITGVISLSNITTSNEKITWEVEEDE